MGSISDSTSSLAQSTKQFCLDNLKTYGSKENCYANKFNEIGENQGPDVGFKVLEALQKTDPDAKGFQLYQQPFPRPSPFVKAWMQNSNNLVSI